VSIKVRAGGAWVESDYPHAFIGGQWRPIARGLVYTGGQWERFHPDIEPTLTEIGGGLDAPVQVAQGVVVFGTVTPAAGTITGGNVTLFQRLVGEGDGAWTAIGADVIFNPGNPVGNWSMTATPVRCGPSEFKAEFDGTASNLPSTSAIETQTAFLGAVGALTGAAIGNETATLTWTAVPGATGYEVRRNGITVDNPTSPTTTSTGLSPNTVYDWQVRAAGPDGCFGTFSPMKQGRTGQDAVVDSGSQVVQIDKSKTGNWRSDGWGSYTTSDVYQGYSSDSSRNYTGVIDYGGAARVQAIIEAALGVNGAQRFANCVVDQAEVYLYRIQAGSGSAVSAGFYTSDSQVNVGGQPGRKGTLVAVQTTGWNAGKWYDVGVEHGEAIVKGTSRSVVTYNNSSANYSKWAAGSFSADSADMRATLSWNYQLTTAVTPAWLN